MTYRAGLEESDEASLNVYPNPVKDVASISCEDIEEISLFNAIGQRIESIDVKGRGDVQIDLSGLPDGVYILRAVSHGRALTRRVVKAE